MGRSSSRYSRRRFISYMASGSVLGLSRSPIAALFSTILAGQSQRAWAQSEGITPRCLLHIFEGGGPMRVFYDSFLTPYSSNGFEANPMVGTQFQNVGGRYMGVEYMTETLRGIEVPPMWTHTLPRPGGGSAPMANMLDNLLCIQGISTSSPGHEEATSRHWLPPGSATSFPAMSADYTQKPIPACHLNLNTYRFKSRKNKTSMRVNNTGNYIENLLDPFKPSGSETFQVRKDALSEAYDSLIPGLDKLAREGHPGAAALVENRRSAQQLIESGIEDLGPVWTGLVLKYRDLIQRAMAYVPGSPLAGFTDRPIGDGTGDPLLYQIQGTTTGNLHGHTDLRNALSVDLSVGRLAENFAFADYVLSNDLSCSVTISAGGIRGFLRPDGSFFNQATMSNDSHESGIFPQYLFGLMRYRAISACMLEIIERLKAQERFEESVVAISGEFNRNPRMDMTGADHGYRGKSISLYSGAFDGPLIVGNLDSSDARKTWGAAGPVAELGGRKLNLIDAAVTLSHILRVPPVFTAASPIVTVGPNGVSSNIGTTRITS